MIIAILIRVAIIAVLGFALMVWVGDHVDAEDVDISKEITNNEKFAMLPFNLIFGWGLISIADMIAKACFGA